jgi:periplasmic protein TonB
MGIYGVPVLLVITVLSGWTSGLGKPLVFQFGPSPEVYEDGPRVSLPSRLHMTESVSAKFLLKKVEPEYPIEAKAARVQGDVIFGIVIGPDGKVEEIHLRRGAPLLVSAAAKAVSEWVYKPYLLNGTAVEVETFAMVRF